MIQDIKFVVCIVNFINKLLSMLYLLLLSKNPTK